MEPLNNKNELIRIEDFFEKLSEENGNSYETTLNRMKEGGINYSRQLLVYPLSKLMENTGIGEITLRKFIEYAKEIENGNIGFRSSEITWKERCQKNILTTGSYDLNALLGRGIQSNIIYEFFGEYSTGKTQIAHQLSVNVQLGLKKGGLEGTALYIDTEGSYSEDRIVQMAEALDLDHDSVLKNIKNARAYNSDRQIELINEMHDFIVERNVKLLIVDSISHHFREEYLKEGNYSEYKSIFYRHLHDLHELSAIYPELVIYITNQVDTKKNVFYGNPIIHIGGHEIAHGSTVRVFLRKGKNDQRIAKLVEAPNLPEGDAYFIITDDGIRDL